jgi:hypothetical protein
MVHPLPKATKKKKKKGASFCQKLMMAPTKTKTKTKKKKKNRVLTFKLVLQNALLLKLQALHSSSSKLPKPKCSTCW